MIRLVLPLPPSSNNAYRNLKGKGRVLTREGREYKQTAALLARGQGATVLDGDVAVRMTVYLADRRRDLDNCAKLVLDSLKHACYADDRQVGYIEMLRRFDRGNPRVELEVTPLADAAAA
jgi:Holliday junction resolvase RusA-like endonuclease